MTGLKKYRLRWICAAIGTLIAAVWLVGLVKRFSVVVRHGSDRTSFLTSDMGRLMLLIQSVEPIPPKSADLVVDTKTFHEIYLSDQGFSLALTYSTGDSFSGFPVYGTYRRSKAFGAVTYSVGYRYYALPYPILIICLWLPLINGWLKFRKRSMRLSMGLCAECGYDMRVTPEQCPECGAKVVS